MSFGDSKVGGFRIRNKLGVLKLNFNYMFNNMYVTYFVTVEN